MTSAAHVDDDEALIARLGAGDQEALRALHHRYAPLVFTVAARLVDGHVAEEVTQDVFVALWTKHETFDSSRGTLSTWLCQIARRKALNVRRAGRVRGEGKHESVDALESVADDALHPDETRWLAQRKEALSRAIAALPSEQRTALTLAFFDELSHEQVAKALHTPVGTAKTRIRTAIKRLAPVLLGLLAVTTALLIWLKSEREKARTERALQMIAASDVVLLRLVPPGASPVPPPMVHGSYRSRPGVDVGVLTTSALPTPQEGTMYRAWIRHGDRWLSVGTIRPRADGGSLSTAIDPSLTTRPDELRVTLERSETTAPTGTTVLTWPAIP